MKKHIVLLFIAFLLGFNTSAFAMAENAECACVMNVATGEVIFSKNINKRHAMASTTKIMTAIVALESCKMDDIVWVSANAAGQEGSSAYVKENDQLYLRDAVYGLMLNSGNDIAVAIAESMTGSVEGFVALMNEKALELGLRNTHFANPNGLDNPEHFTTAGDLAIIARYAMANDDFREIVATQTYQAKPLNSEGILYFSNHNKLLGIYEGATGVKTGYTTATGRCLVSSAKRDGMEFIVVTLNDNNDWNEHMEMLDYAFSEHYPKKVIEKNQIIKVAKIDNKSYNMVAAEDYTIPFKENGGVNIELISHMADNLKSPINAGEKVGYIEIRCNDMTVDTVDIISETEIGNVTNLRLKNSFYSGFMRVLKKLLV